MKDQKKFKDTKLGQFLKTKAPKILEKVGDLLPDSGVLGIVKNLIDKSPELTPAEKEMAHQHMKELYELEVRDRESARSREVEVAKAGKFDFMFTLTGIIGLAVFVFIVYVIVYLEVPKENKELFIHLIGIAEGVVLSIFGYYFGSAVKKNIQ
jgi:hypothetical protein